MEAQHAELSTRFGLESSKLGDIETSLKQNVETVMENMQSLEARMAVLGK